MAVGDHKEAWHNGAMQRKMQQRQDGSMETHEHVLGS